jgi:hypothetical protein
MAPRGNDDPSIESELRVSPLSFRYRLLHEDWMLNGLTAPCGTPGTSLGLKIGRIEPKKGEKDL